MHDSKELFLLLRETSLKLEKALLDSEQLAVRLKS